MAPPYTLEFPIITFITSSNYILVFQNFYLMSAFLLYSKSHEDREDVDFILHFISRVKKLAWCLAFVNYMLFE